MKIKGKHFRLRGALSVLLALLMLLSCAPLGVFASAAETEYKTGDIIEFGSYPQSEVTDSALKSALTSRAGSTSGWTSYDYYISGAQSDYMKYTDVEYGGAKYRGVYFTQYRPSVTTGSSSTDRSYQDDNGYNTSTVYWFKYEPMKWQVLSFDKTTGNAMVLSKDIIDSQQYYNNSKNRTIGVVIVYRNNYEHSDIRAWLNGTFYDGAFSASEKNAIIATTLDNSAYSEEYSQYDSNSTTDKVWLLSYSEAQNTAYGFTSNKVSTESRQAKGSAYALCQGLYKNSSNGCSKWRLRSASNDFYIHDACFVGIDGYVFSHDDYCDVRNTDCGVRPALKINLTSEIFSSEKYNVGDTVTLGSYPQSEVTDTALKSALTSRAGSTSGWTSYNYYISGAQSDYMKYTDVEYGGAKYRGVYFTQYRPYRTVDSSSTDNSYQDDNGYNTFTVYWFKYEPMKWQVLSFDKTTGNAVVLSKDIIDSQQYYNNLKNRTIGGVTVYSNNYEHSDIRAWLNGTFYDGAFTASEKNAIIATTLDNSAYSEEYSQYDSNSTTDKVWLLSYSEAQNTAYGFTSNTSSTESRQAKGSAYALCQGLWKHSSNGCSYWRLRSAGDYYRSACFVDYDGYVDGDYGVSRTSRGVRPALKINLTSEIFSSEKYNVGDTVTLGSYPQSEVTDSSLKNALSNKAGTAASWESYNFYEGGAKSDFMKYVDVDYNGAKYRGVRFTKYRPALTYSAEAPEEPEQQANGYSVNTTYWFKYEPLEWTVTAYNASTGAVSVRSKRVIDSREFYAGSEDTRTIDGSAVYRNNYKHSDIRAWLNGDFVSGAFTSAERCSIIPVMLDNSAFDSAYSQFDSAATADKVYLLSYNEVQNTAYGFAGSVDDSPTRETTGTDYAKALGVYADETTGAADWWLRTAGDSQGDACYIDSAGYVNEYNDVRYTKTGVVPALTFNPDNPGHTPAAAVEENRVEATCTENGGYDSVVYCANCGEELSREAKTINPTGHTPAAAVEENRKEPNCFEKGSYDSVVYCSVCDEVLSTETVEFGEPLGHIWENIVHGHVCPTKDTVGYTYGIKECVRIPPCSVVTPAVEEVLDEFAAEKTEIIEAPTCTENGKAIIEYTCPLCGRIVDSEERNIKDALGHDFTEKIIDEAHLAAAATKTSPALYYYDCSRCETIGTETFAYPDDPQKDYKVGDEFTFGSYPQSEVTASSVKTQLDSLAGDVSGWTSYGYYADGKQGDYMKYKDVTLDGEKYRGVYFTGYRPYYNLSASSEANSYQDNNGYVVNTAYWFKFEPVTWRVLAVNGSNKTVTVMAKYLLDSQDFYNTHTERTVDGKTVYANNYEHSDIRAWLNGEFFGTAFTAAQQGDIIAAEIENKAFSTTYSQFDSASTVDKLWILSYSDTKNADYGFATTADAAALGTDYAKAQGIYVSAADGNSIWRLRTAGSSANYNCCIGATGSVSNRYAAYSYGGIRPAMILSTASSTLPPVCTEHTPGEWVETKAATCTKAGERQRSCTVCGKILDIEPTPFAHDWGDWTVVSASTCTETGTRTRTCGKCGKIQSETTEPLKHNFEKQYERKATCTEKGFVFYLCSRAGCTESKNEVSLPLGHDYGFDNICKRCGKVLPGNHVHSFKNQVVLPTCSAMGYTLHICECGYSYTDEYVEPVGHRWDNGTVKKEKSCYTDGIIIYSCTADGCDASYETKIPASHNWNETVITPATCTTDGKKTKTCKDCSAVEEEVIKAGHKVTVWTENKPATCTEPGVRTGVCPACGKTVTENTDALGHEYYDGKCIRCGESFMEHVKESKTSPNYGMYFQIDDVVSNYGPDVINEYGVYLHHNSEAQFNKVAVYLTQDGTMWRRCIACTGDGITTAVYVPYLSNGEEIKYTGLNSNWINTFTLSENSSGIWNYSNYATIGVNLEDNKGNMLLTLCDVGIAGKQTRIFDDLDEMIKWLSGDCVSHDYSMTVTIEPTCTRKGEKTYSCKKCSYSYKEEIPMLPHSYSVFVNNNNGTHSKKCAECSYIVTENCSLKSTIVPPTAKKQGYTEHTCSVCGYSYKDAFTDPVPEGELVDETLVLFNSNNKSPYGCSYYGKNSSWLTVSNPNFNAASIDNGGYDIYANHDYSPITQIGIPFTVKADITEDAKLILNCYDVDENQGERDYIYLVNETDGSEYKLSGYLSGMDEQWNSTTFAIPAKHLVKGNTYHFKLNVAVTGWHVFVRTANLELSSWTEPLEKAEFSAHISGNTIKTSLFVKTLTNAKLTLEYKAVCGMYQYGSYFADVNATPSGVTVPADFDLEKGAPAGTYQITVYIKDSNGKILNSLSATASKGSKYSVSYHSNGGSNTVPADGVSYEKGENVTVLFTDLPSRPGYIFMGWSKNPSASTPAFTADGVKSFTMGNSDVDLYAVWAGNVCKHTFNAEVVKKATCTENGLMLYKCYICGYSYTETIKASHLYKLYKTIEATCTVDGKKIYRCEKCGDEYYDIIKGGHNYISEVTKKATKTEPGIITYTCTKCGNMYTEEYTIGSGEVLLVQDIPSWQTNSDVALLQKLLADGKISTWNKVTSAMLADTDVSGYDVILIANDQVNSTYTNLAACNNLLTDFAENGGVVIYGACDNGWVDGNITYTLPGGVEKQNYYSHYNYILDYSSPIVTGEKSDGSGITNALLEGNYCSHSYFTASSLPTNANVIIADGNGNATLAEYRLGNGRIILSGLTWEFYYERDYSTFSTTYSKQVYDDLILYALDECYYRECNHIEKIEFKAPTCTEAGYEKTVCTVCGKTLENNIIEALGHDLSGEYTVIKKGSCTENGIQALSCARCGKKIVDGAVIPARGHKLSDKVLVSPPSTTTGAVWECRCENTANDYYTACDYIERITDPICPGHTLGDWIVDKNATCTSTGLKHRNCTICSYSEITVIPLLPHTPGEKVTVVEATCTESGLAEIRCANCGTVLESITIPARGHLPGEWITVKAATCKEKGVEQRLCKHCSTVLDTRDIPLSDHSRGEWMTVKEPTCTEKGLKTVRCTVCEKILDSAPIPAKDHTPGEWITVKAPTCSEQGSAEQRCVNCGTLLGTDVLATVDHRDMDNDGFCDWCGKELESHKCNCLCHKSSAISKFFWKILRFFYKIFRVNKVCTCGDAHW